MVRVWYLDEDTSSDQRFELHQTTQKNIDVKKLKDLTGVEYFKLDPVEYEKEGKLDKIRKERGYSYEDEITCSKECLPDYEKIMKTFYEEHLHNDEEIRFVLDGQGYFDVRDYLDRWIRIEANAGDMLVIPSGLYHRFTLDMKKFIKAKRLFSGEPCWLAYYRPSADKMECRKNYIEKMKPIWACSCHTML